MKPFQLPLAVSSAFPRIRLFSLFVACLAGLSAFAQDTASYGSVAGRVQHAATGQYLTNARIRVQGTNLEAYTDETGAYQIDNVPAGTIALDVFYTGLDPKTVSVDLLSGASRKIDVSLTNVRRYGALEEDERYELDRFDVTERRMTEGAALAVNEQRFAPNIKNVVSTDAFGSNTDGNVADFMKYLPGVSADFEGDSARSISVRGFGANMTQVSIDGSQIANAASTGDSREFHFKQVSINDTSRIEVTKVPTPATAASTMAGSVNLVSKSAFERNKARFNYNLLMSGNLRDYKLGNSPHSHSDKKTWKVNPGFSFDYTLPINENLGIIITGLNSVYYKVSTYDVMNWQTTGTATGASLTAPRLQSYGLVDFPGYRNRYSLSLKTDWRATPNSVLSVSLQTTYYSDFNGNNRFDFSTGANGNPTPASGVRFSYGPDYAIGATGRGAVTMGNNHSTISGQMNRGGVRYRFDRGAWHVDASLDYSKSRTWRRYTSEGTFRALATRMRNPVRVELHDITKRRPGQILVFDNNNNPVDYNDVSNYIVTGANADSSGDVHEEIASASVNARRRFDIFSVPFSVQIGARQQVQTRDRSIDNFGWTHSGLNGDTSAAPYLSQVYAGYKDYPTIGRVPWLAPSIAYSLWQENPALFTKTTADRVAEKIDHVLNSEYIEEVTDGYYIQGDIRLLDNRLRVLGGVRYESTKDTGRGPLVTPDNIWQRNPDGSFVLTSPGGDRIRRPEAGANNSLEQVALTHHERGATSTRDYDGLYPSAHFTYNITENLLFRLAYAKTYGRPDFNAVIPNTDITEFADLEGGGSSNTSGVIRVRNTGLLPWTADNYDLSLEYYTRTGGVFSAGVFLKEIKNFFGDIVKDATLEDLQTLGLDPRYVDWELRTSFNSGDARVSGIEASFRQSLGIIDFLGTWGENFEVFANVTKLRLEGDRLADFSGFIPFSANWGIDFRRGPFRLNANWHHRGEQRVAPFPNFGPDAYTWYTARTTVDLYASYALSSRLTLFVSANDAFNKLRPFIRRGSLTPDYATVNRTENYGTRFDIGIKGTF